MPDEGEGPYIAMKTQMAEHAQYLTSTICILLHLLSFHTSPVMNRRKLHLNKVTVSLSCSCIKPKLSDIFQPKPKPKPSSASKNLPPPSTTTTTTTTNSHTPTESPASVGGRFGRMGGDGLAVEKDSDDPYLDFRQSMLQMIVENEIYSEDDLRELLNCFLQLNSPYHHGIIIRAFTDIWNGVFSVRPVTKRVRRKARPETDCN